jgi:hypothetical protein
MDICLGSGQERFSWFWNILIFKGRRKPAREETAMPPVAEMQMGQTQLTGPG